MPIRLFVFLLGIVSFTVGNANDSVALAQPLILQAKQAQLDEHPTWLKLLNISNKNGISDIHSSEFFLSGAVRAHAEQELEATLRAFLNPIPENQNAHAMCAFRGRYVWLRKMLSLENYELPSPSCDEYNDWSHNDDIESISVVFATGFLNNPASYYGHVLIKINTRDQKVSDLEDVSINFGANIPPNEGMMPYIFKGLLGGYESSFTHSEYFYHSHNYAESELRDLWEYKLGLSSYDIDLVLGHLWEILGKKYTYYFLTKNCAHRMAEALALLDIDVIPDTTLWSMPQAFLKKLALVDRNGSPLVAEVIRHPSRQSSLYNRFSQLGPMDQQLLKQIIANHARVEMNGFKNLPLTQQHAIIDTLLDYYQYRRGTDEEVGNEFNQSYKVFLSKRYQLAPGPSPLVFSQEDSPDKGRKLSYSAVSAVHSTGVNGVKYRVRPALYDSLDASYGHGAGAALSMADVEVAIIDGRLMLRRLDIVKVEAINKLTTGLPGDRGSYWGLNFGWRPDSLACVSCSKPNFALKKGLAANVWSDRWLIAPYIGGGLNENSRVNDTLFVQAGVFSTFQLDTKSNIKVELNYLDQLLDNDSVDRATIDVEYRYKLGENNDIRLSYNKDIAEELSLTAGWYW